MAQESARPGAAPDAAADGCFLSLVVPAYNVSAFVGELLDSLTRQTRNHGFDPTIEMIVIDDGSTDDTGAIVQRWMATDAWFGVRYVRQENAGPSAARNVGIAMARGTWVTWPDSDDLLRPDYLDVALARLETLPPEVCLAAARILLLKPDLSVTDSHPLRRKFHQGSRIVDLEHQPEFIQLQAASAFYRRSVITAAGLQLDPEVRPNFEDAFFTALFLDAAPSRKIALMPDAHYVYRRRDDGTSLVQQSWAQHAKYDHLPRAGYLRLVETFAARHGSVPQWVQNLVLYDLSFYFREDARMHSATALLPDAVCAEFHEVVRAILAHVDDATLAGFAVYPTNLLLKETLAIGYKHPRWVPDRVRVHRVDRRQQIAQVRYLYGERAPLEEVRVDGEPAVPLHAKVRDLSFFGRVLAHERIFWVPATATLRLSLDGRQVPLELGPPRDVALAVSPNRMWNTLVGREVPRFKSGRVRALTTSATAASAAPAAPARTGLVAPVLEVPTRALRRVRRVARRLRRRVDARLGQATTGAVRPVDEALGGPDAADLALLRRARTPGVRRRFADAWVFMDRDTMAQDNAEHLYRWVRRHHPEVNAWFVLTRGSSDWPRLEREGFRLVDPASDDHVLLMKNALHRISSQADHYVVRPIDPGRFGAPGGRFTFLQHGVIQSDLSRWLSHKPISLMLTTTRDELESIVGDHTPYLFTTKEVSLLGMPRHDRLLALAADPARRPRRLLVAPTWRRELLGEADSGNHREVLPGLWESPYMTTWLAVLESPEVQDLARRHGLVLSFLPHPNLDAHLDDDRLPPHVDVLHYRDGDVQEVLADTAVLVTDYSSLAFELALLQRPVVYHQHDRETFLGGGHIGRPGSWSYEKNGFGPVTETLPDLVHALDQVVEVRGGLRGPEVYRVRAEDAFPFTDGGSCERVYERILAIRRPHPEALRDWRSRLPEPTLVPAAVHEPLRDADVDRDADADVDESAGLDDDLA